MGPLGPALATKDLFNDQLKQFGSHLVTFLRQQFTTSEVTNYRPYL